MYSIKIAVEKAKSTTNPNTTQGTYLFHREGQDDSTEIQRTPIKLTASQGWKLSG